jgi:hypothetical protein
MVPWEAEMSDPRQRVHQMIDRLPSAQLSAVEGLLGAILDEEPAIEEARQWLRENGGRGIPHEEILADFGLTMDDFRRMGEDRARQRG